MSKLAKSLLLAASLSGLLNLENIVQAQNNLISDGVISYWKFDESSGNAADSIGLHTLINYGPYSSYAPGKINNGAVMGGGNKFSAVANDFILGTNNFTISCWFKSSGANTRVGIMCNDPSWSNVGSWRLACHESQGGRLGFYSNNNSVNYSPLLTPNNVLDNNWHEVTIVREGIGIDQTKMYLDGNIVANSTYADNFTSNKLYIGADGFESVSAVEEMDEVGLWNRALNSSEVSRLNKNGGGLSYPFQTEISLNISIGQDINNIPQIDFSILSPYTNRMTIQETSSLSNTNWTDKFSYTPISVGTTTFNFPLESTNKFYRVIQRQ